MQRVGNTDHIHHETEGGVLLEAAGTETGTGTLLGVSVLAVASLGRNIECEAGSTTEELEQPSPLVMAYLVMKAVIAFKHVTWGENTASNVM
jgi:hypothetical protein